MILAMAVVLAGASGVAPRQRKESYPSSDLYQALKNNEYQTAEKIYKEHGTVRHPLSPNEKLHYDILTQLATLSRYGHRVPSAIEAIDWCINRRADIRAGHGRPLIFAARNDVTGDLVKHLLRRGARVSDSHPKGMTAIGTAIEGNHPHNVRILLDHGASPNAAFADSGDTPLIFASREGRLEIVKLLIEKKAKVNAANARTGRTALMSAAERGQTEVAKFLLSKKASKTVKDKTGRTALAIAKAKGHTGVASLLK